MTTHCCVPFEEKAKSKQVEQGRDDGHWHINGCCGGGCYVMYDISFCPYCGKKLSTEKTQ